MMRNHLKNALLSLLIVCSLCACGARHSTVKKPFIVASADHRATQAGINILKNGGSAVDAAVAVQSVLSLVEPQSSGVGGGAFMLYYDASSKQLHSFDGREKSPASMRADAFLKPDGKPKHYFDVAFGGQAVGVPGVMALLGKTHKQYGKLPWHHLFAEAEQMAEQGFTVSPRLSQWLQRFPNKGAHPTMLSYFYDEDGQARPAGYTLKNPQFANTMRITTKEGAKAYYTGSIAKQISEAVSSSPIAPRQLTLQDLAHYKAIEREAICAPYHDYKVCSMGPPTSGGIFMLQVLGMLAPFDLKQETPFSDKANHLMIEASRLAYADRQQFIADPDLINVPTQALLNKAYLSKRAKLINPSKAANHVQAGKPEVHNKQALLRAPHVGTEQPSTSHFSIMDSQGNVVSMTTTVQGPFGSFLPAGGFILNNQLTDFSYLPTKNGVAIANAAAPNKRPRSSMTPTIVFDKNGEVFMVIGSPGGGRIFSYVLKTIISVLDWRMSMQAAIDAPNISLPKGIADLEKNRFDIKTIQALSKMGHQIQQNTQESGLNGFIVTSSGFDGGVDQRREGSYMIESHLIGR